EAIELLVRDGEEYRTLKVVYEGGLRYPHRERIPGTPDRLEALFPPRRVLRCSRGGWLGRLLDRLRTASRGLNGGARASRPHTGRRPAIRSGWFRRCAAAPAL